LTLAPEKYAGDDPEIAPFYIVIGSMTFTLEFKVITSTESYCIMP